MKKPHRPIITRIISAITILILFSISLTFSTFAAESTKDPCSFQETQAEKDACSDLIKNQKKIPTALGNIPYETDKFVPALLGFIVGIAGASALLLMIVGAALVLTGGSNPEQVKRGKEVFTGAATGLLFIVFSAVILRIIAGDIIKLPGF